MSDSIDTSNPAHTAIKAVLANVLALQNDDQLTALVTDLTNDQSWQVHRVFEVARLVEHLLQVTPATLISGSHLTSIANQLQQIYSELTSFRSNRNLGHISNITAYIDNILPLTAGFGGQLLGVNTEGVGKVILDLRTRSQSAIRAINESKNIVATELDTMREHLVDQERRIAELTANVETQKKEAIAVSAEVRAAYSKVETELRAEFATALSNMGEKSSALTGAIIADGDTSLRIIKRLEENARQIVQVVGNIGVTGNYQNNAKSEADTANLMRWLTLAFFAAGVVIAMAVLVAHLFPSISPVALAPSGPWELGLRLLTALAIATPALYTARESARHRTNSDRAKQRELELASLGPFIELLPQDKKDEIVHKLTEKYFGSSIDAHEIKAVFDPKDFVDLAKQAIEGLSKAAK